MNIIKTKSFEISTYESWDMTSWKLAIVCPGKLDSGQYAHMESHRELLASLWYFAISIDPVWTRNSPWDISLYTMSNYIQSIHEIIDFYWKENNILIGHSMGWFVSMMVGCQNDKVQALVNIMWPYENTQRKAEELLNQERKNVWYRTSRRDNIWEQEKKEFKLPYGYIQDLVKLNADKVLSETSKPKLFIAGKKDITILPEMVKWWFDIAKDQKKYVEVDTEHDYRLSRLDIKKVEEEINAFFSGIK